MAALLGFSRLYLTSEVRFKSLGSTAVMVNTGFSKLLVPRFKIRS